MQFFAKNINRFRTNSARAPHELAGWLAEKRLAWLYRAVSDSEPDTARQILFLELAQAAEKQAGLWAAEMRKAGMPAPRKYTPDLPNRLAAWLVRRMGPWHAWPALEAMKLPGMAVYTSKTAGRPARSLARRSGLVAATAGIGDGLVSNLSLLFGVAGATGNNGLTLLSGLAGLVSGAFVMAAGSRARHGQSSDEPALEMWETAELVQIFQARGLDTPKAQRLAETIIADPDRAPDILANAGLELPAGFGSPGETARFSLYGFMLGATIPLLPFVVARGEVALIASAIMTAPALLAAGAATGLFTGRHAFRSGLRTLATGGTACALTYLIGKAAGIWLG